MQFPAARLCHMFASGPNLCAGVYLFVLLRTHAGRVRHNARVVTEPCDADADLTVGMVGFSYHARTFYYYSSTHAIACVPVMTYLLRITSYGSW